jgi:hypothetical protein
VGRALFGLDRPGKGEIVLDGREITLTSPRFAMMNGIGFVSSNRQIESLAMNLSVRENFFLNPANRGFRWNDRIDPNKEKSEAATWVERYDVRPRAPEQSIETLSGVTAAGVKPTGQLFNISAGDGSTSAYQRITLESIPICDHSRTVERARLAISRRIEPCICRGTTEWVHRSRPYCDSRQRGIRWRQEQFVRSGERLQKSI